MVLEYLHALFMVIGFSVMTAGFVSVRFFKRKSWWLKLHKNLGISSVFLLLTGLCFEIIHLSLIGAGHFNVLHARLGLIIVFLSLITLIMGLMQIKMHRTAKKIRPFHRWSGRVLIMLMFINIISGLYTLGLF